MAQQKLTVGDLRKALEGLDDSRVITVQNNVEGDEDVIWDDEGNQNGTTGNRTYTESIGFVFGAFARGDELVINVAVTDSEL